ncbi:hypothetical protein BC833DRAFT_619209 [Globomyces pollinis-pini]|nr:hypothetical protein BC833DRAFT_619209 [Globomyces pollinis-pini]
MITTTSYSIRLTILSMITGKKIRQFKRQSKRQLLHLHDLAHDGYFSDVTLDNHVFLSSSNSRRAFDRNLADTVTYNSRSPLSKISKLKKSKLPVSMLRKAHTSNNEANGGGLFLGGIFGERAALAGASLNDNLGTMVRAESAVPINEIVDNDVNMESPDEVCAGSSVPLCSTPILDSLGTNNSGDLKYKPLKERDNFQKCTLESLKKLKVEDVSTLRMAGVLNSYISLVDELNLLPDGSIKLKFK